MGEEVDFRTFDKYITGDKSKTGENVIHVQPRGKLQAYEDMIDIKYCLGEMFKPKPSTQYKIDRIQPSFEANLERPEIADKRWAKGLITVDVEVTGKVVTGFQRGGKQLGVPTANVEMTDQNKELLKNVVPGIYMAWCHHAGTKYKAAVSVGWNPVYNNAEKTLEAHIIDKNELVDFYGEEITVQLVKYIRAEALYADFDALIIAISADIKTTIDEL